uniref:Uncharacterized protein n=2 Tax=Candidatus Kentrum sp. LFY TaxID=2126342 RepID=A0A450UTP8_9GAMM|nr:MAG: hypothetical protein BECKLFY1418A_GA0070994_10546 [Candidatus Kentron sp. LFY]
MSLWRLHVSRSFERSIRQIPKEYQRRIVAWHNEHAGGISDPADLDKVAWLTRNNIFNLDRLCLCTPLLADQGRR